MSKLNKILLKPLRNHSRTRSYCENPTERYQSTQYDNGIKSFNIKDKKYIFRSEITGKRNDFIT